MATSQDQSESPRAPRGLGGGGVGGGYDGYVSPLAGRYASAEMQSIWSARRRFGMWRRIWLAVAEAQQACGLEISDEAIAELRAHLDPTDDEIRAAEAYERELRHDVMAHVHALGDVCPAARPIIHLGMTSQDVNDNAELLLIYDSIQIIDRKIDALLVALGAFAERWRSLPVLGLTHYQPAQPTTIGRRSATWAMDLSTARGDHDFYANAPLRGLRGATGTQASFLALFDGDERRVHECEARFLWTLLVTHGYVSAHGSLEDHLRAMSDMWIDIEEQVEGGGSDEVADEMRRQARRSAEWNLDPASFVSMHTFGPTGQTYPRIFDAQVIGLLANPAAVLHKIATDIRLLSGRGELSEPTGSKQIGSSAMPHKRNPMKCERVCALARFVMNLVPNALDTAATQWLERTLDDSANRRLTLPEAFLALDGCLDLMRTVVEGLEVHEAVIRKNLDAELPFLAGENLMMQAARLGRDRQDVHEAIRRHARAAADRIKNEGADNDLLDRLKTEPLLEGVDFSKAMDPMTHIGLAREQVDEFIRSVIEPLRADLEADAGPSDRGV